jgi:cytochrome c553
MLGSDRSRGYCTGNALCRVLTRSKLGSRRSRDAAVLDDETLQVSTRTAAAAISAAGESEGVINRIRPKERLLRLDPESYEQLCQTVLQRDGRRLASGTASSLEVHHKQHRSQSGDDSEWNLITLCAACHVAKPHGINLRFPVRSSSFAVLAVNHRTRIARDRYRKHQNAKIQEIMRNDTWCAEKACTPEPRCPINPPWARIG